MKLTVRNKTNSKVSLDAILGSLGRVQTKTYDLTLFELEKVRFALLDLEKAGVIEFTTENDEQDSRAEGATVAFVDLSAPYPLLTAHTGHFSRATEAFRVRDFEWAAPLLVTAWNASNYATAGRLRIADLRGCIPTRSENDTAIADGIHPTPLSYERMASALWPTLLNALGRSAEW